MAVEFEDNRVKVKDAIGSAAIVFLHEMWDQTMRMPFGKNLVPESMP